MRLVINVYSYWLLGYFITLIQLQKFIRGRIQKSPDWPLRARTANGAALCHLVQLYRYSVSQSSEFCRRNPLCYFLTSNTKGKHMFLYRLSPETFGHALVCNAY
jgi:hypothetical protein